MFTSINVILSSNVVNQTITSCEYINTYINVKMSCNNLVLNTCPLSIYYLL